MASTIDIKFDVKMNGAGQIKGLKLDLLDLQKVMTQAGESAARASKRVSASWYESISKVSATCAQFNNTLSQLTNGLTELSAGYADFDKAMRAVNTMAGKDEAGFGQLKEQVDALAGSIPLAKSALADGLYQVISNGVPEANWMEYLEASAKASVGGLADLGQVVGVTSTVIKNYGLDWAEAQSIQDKIQLTAKNGVTSFEQLAAALPRVTGNAATLGVSIDELMATFATLTGVSGNTAEVSTQLAAIFTALVKPSSEAAKMAEAMGIQFDAAAIRAAGGFQNFLSMLDNSVKEYSAASGILAQEVYGKLFGSAESLRALIPLQGELASKFHDNAAAMADSAGTVDGAFQNMNSTAEAAQMRMKNAIDSAISSLAKLANAALPKVQLLASFGQATMGIVSLTNALRVMGSNFKNVGANVAQFATRMVHIAGVYRAASLAGHQHTAFLISCTRSFKQLKALLVTSGIGLALVAIGTAFNYISDKSEEAANRLKDASEAIENAANAMKSAEESVAIEIHKEISELEKLIISKQDASKAVENLNKKYKDSFGTYETAAEWYRVLSKNAAVYAKIQGEQARRLELDVKLGDLELQRQELEKRRAEMKRSGAVSIKHYGKDGKYERVEGSGKSDYIQLGKDLKKVQDNISAITGAIKLSDKEIDKWETHLTSVRSEAPEVNVDEPKTPDDGDKDPKSTAPVYRENARTLEQYEENLRALDTQLRKVDPANVAEIQRLRELKATTQDYITALRERMGLEQAGGMRGEGGKVRAMEPLPRFNEQQIGSAQLTPPQIDTSNLQLATTAMDQFSNSTEYACMKMKDLYDRQSQMVGAVGDVGSVMGSLGGAIDGAAGSWLSYGGQVLQTVSQVLPQILALTSAQWAAAMANATNSGAALPPPFNYIAIAAGVAAVIAAMAKVPKFAAGGIAYGPTLGLFGEYAGASNNPEVVAPLNKLRDLIEPRTPAMGGRVVFEVKGRRLVGVLNNVDNYNNRT